MTARTMLAGKFALIAGISVLTASCVTEVQQSPAMSFSDTSVISVYDPDTAIAAGSTIAWLPEAVHYYKDDRIKDAQLKSLIEEQIVASLKLKNMNLVESVNGARYAIAYTAALASSLDDDAIIRRFGLLPGNAQIPDYDANIEKGSLIIYVYDNRTDQVIWRSAAQAGVKFDMPTQERKQRMARVVEEMFLSFPVAK